MQKQYKTICELVKESGILDMLEYKFLELRDRFPLFNMVCTEGILFHINSAAFHECYIARWDNKGRLAYFNPKPNYPKDFTTIDPESNQPVKISDKELRERTPNEFARTLAEILDHEGRFCFLYE